MSSRDRSMKREWNTSRKRHRSRSRSRSRSPKRDSHHQNGENSSGSSPNTWMKTQQFSTASRTSQRKKSKTTPYEVFARHMAEHKPDLGYCGFYWHSTRLARKGTDYIFTESKQEFQKRAKDNKINWEDAREMLFMYKKTFDQLYRNMLYHFRNTKCTRCDYWDDVYLKHLAHVNSSDSQNKELTDQEMLEAAMEIDGPSN
ncbi:NP1 [Squirrel bocaparvovirus]|nr:NP1 [Squirrel bocaparvovirus]